MPFFIFDMDGTLTDSNFMWRNYGARFLQSKGITPPENCMYLVQTMGFRQFPQWLIDTYGLSETPDDIRKWVLADIEKQYACVLLKGDALSFLQEVKSRGIRMCVATATDHYLADPVLKRLGVWDYFDFVYTCTDVGAGKSKPDIFNRCCEKFGCDRSQAVIFEDAHYAVQTAKNAGFYVVGIEEATEMFENEVKATVDQYITCYAELDFSKLPK